MVIDSLFQKMSQIYQSTCQCSPPFLPLQNKTANMVPNSKLFQFQVKVTFWLSLMYPPRNEKVGNLVNIFYSLM